MPKQRYVGQMISGKALNNKKVPIGTVVVWEPSSGFKGVPSLLTVEGWIRQDDSYAGHYGSAQKEWRILHVGNGEPRI